jgi:uncharacterized protein YjbJ (UPF0337 family)
MGERMDELKGNIKQGVGKVSGDTDLQAEGEAERDTAHATRETKGVGNQIKGGVEEGLGKVTTTKPAPEASPIASRAIRSAPAKRRAPT